MKLTYDTQADALNIKLDQSQDYDSSDSFAINGLIPFGDINIDFSKESKILGFEVLIASKYFSESFLSNLKHG